MAIYAKAALLATVLVAALATGSMAAGPMKAGGKPSGKAPSGAKDTGATDCKAKVIYRYLALHKYAEGTDMQAALDLEVKSLSNCTANFYRAAAGKDLEISQSIFGASAAANWQFSKILDFETLDGILAYKACQKLSVAVIAPVEKAKVIYNVTACPGDSLTTGYAHAFIYNHTTNLLDAPVLAKLHAAVEGLHSDVLCVSLGYSNGADNKYDLGEPQNFHPYGGDSNYKTINLLRAFWANARGPPTNPYLLAIQSLTDNIMRIQFAVSKIK